MILSRNESADHITTRYRHIENVGIYTVTNLKTGNTSFFCRLPGASVTEFFEEVRIGNIFSHIPWKRELVRAYLDALYSKQQTLGLKLLERFYSPFGGELRYYIPDESLNSLLFDSWVMFGAVCMRMRQVWKMRKMLS